MAELPEFVRQRMAQPGAGDHPDADLLTAFAENSLRGEERARVLAHLAACAACRDVVALTLPEVPAPQPVLAPQRHWLRWPVLHWSAVAATVVIVAAAVLMKQANRAPSLGDERTAPIAAPAPQTAADQQTKPAPPAEAAKPAPPRTAPKAAQVVGKTTPVVKEKGSEPRPEAKLVAPGAKDEFQALHRETTVAVSAQPAATLKRAPAPSTVTDAAAPPAARPAPPPAGEVEAASGKPQRKDAMAGAVVGGAAPASGMLQQAEQARMSRRAAPAMMRAAPMLWRVADNGAIERSADAGRNWVAVPVVREAGFRAISSIGSDVWAGGVRGMLFHSADGGRTWTRVVPRAGDVTLVSDVVRVEFTDLLHGAVITASGETWTTNDGGRTWTVTPAGPRPM